MPKSSMNTCVARQWEILKIVPKLPNFITSGEIKDKLNIRGFEVSKRTVERDLRDLSNVFALASNEDAQPFKWYWLKNMENEFGGIILEEAISLSLASDILKTTLPDFMLKPLKHKFELSSKKLENLEDLSVAKLKRKFRYVAQSLPFAKVNIEKNLMDNIQAALIKDRQIKVKYDAKDKATKEYVLNPLGIVQQGVRSYLIVTIDGFNDILKFALQRIRKVNVLDEKSKIPKNFSLDKFLENDAMQFGECNEIKLKAIISENLATYLEESAISNDQKIRFKNNNWQITATVKNSWYLWLWIRSQGSDITVISPKKLRKELIEDLKISLEDYKSHI